jgi:hypothetical protein
MSTSRLAHLAVVVSCLGALVLGACSSSTKSTESSTTTGATGASRTFAVTTDDGQVSISLDGELPPNWPDDFPVPDGAEPAGSGSLGGTERTVLVGVYSASGAARDTFDFYTSSPDVTVESSSSIGSGTSFIGTIETSGEYAGRITVLSHDDQTLVVVVLDASGTGDTTGATSGAQPNGTVAS